MQPPTEDRYRLMIEEIKDYAILMLDPEGYVSSWNIGAERIKGYTADEIIGKHFSIFYTPEDARNEKPKRLMAEALREGRSEVEGWRVRKNGTRFWANGVITALYDLEGRHIGFGKITRDLTERKKAEDAYFKQEMELVQTRKLEAIGQLAGGVAHDFNNILTGIMGVTQEVISTLPPDDNRVEDLQMILEAGQRAFDVTKQLLAFGRRQIVQSKILDVNDAINKFGKLVRRLIGEDIKLHFDLKPIFHVRMDPGQLDQVLLNLIVNARDAVSKGGDITVRTGPLVKHPQNGSKMSGADPSDYIVLEVRDTGEGMDDETITHIFEPFFTTKEKGKGTGLGLATVYGIVRQAGGEIEVSSVRGKGSVFRIFLPAVQEPVPSEMEALPVKTLVESACVLVVEDESIVRQVIARKLKRLGCRVLEAKDGDEALRILQTELQIDILLTDVIMPGMNGRELVETVRRTHPQIRAVYMSGYPEDVLAKKDILEDSVAYIEKSDLDEKLTSTLSQVLNCPLK